MSSTRQLAAIMFTDIAGYTALMGADERKAMELVRRNKEIQKPLVEKYGGTWLKEMGDGAMSSFTTASDAIYCAMEIQKALFNDKELNLRIGIHLGEIILEEGDIYGDGVNIASRLESIAEPGGIYISDSVQKAIRSNTDIQSVLLGELDLKNVDYPVKTYALRGEFLPQPKKKEEKKLSGTLMAELQRRNVPRAGIAYLAFAFIVFNLLHLLSLSPTLIWVIYGALLLGFPMSVYLAWNYERSPEGFVKITSRKAWKNPYTEQQKKPFTGNLAITFLLVIGASIGGYSIRGSQHAATNEINRSLAILPFDDMSPGKDQQYFSDGVMDEVLTRLSQISDLRLISRTTMEKYRSTPKTVMQVSDELQVGFVLEGSVQKIDDKVRVIVQLIDGTTDSHVWSESYYRDMTDIFKIQTEISQAIAKELNIQLGADQQTKLAHVPTQNLSAYDLFLQADAIDLNLGEEKVKTALSLYNQVIDLDPGFALAWARMGETQRRMRAFGYQRSIWYDSAMSMINHAIELEPGLAAAYLARADILIRDDQWDLAVKDLEMALKLDPNNAEALGTLGYRKIETGDLEDGVSLVLQAWSRQVITNQDDPEALNSLAGRFSQVGSFDSALGYAEKSLKINPNQVRLSYNLSYAYFSRGDIEKANSYYKRAIKLEPNDYNAMREMARNLSWQGKNEEALEWFKKSDKIVEDFEQKDLVSTTSHRYGYALVQIGDSLEGRKIINQVLEESLKRVESEQLTYGKGEFYDISAINAYKGNVEEAVYWMKRAKKEGWISLPFLKYDPLLENIRNHPDIEKMISEMEEDIEKERREFRKQIQEQEENGQLKLIKMM